MKERDCGQEGSGKGHFFMVDHRTWAKVCGLGMGPAVAYLVLACGTQANNQDTDWSVNAVTKYADISVVRGKNFVAALVEDQVVAQTKSGTRPHYVLRSWRDVESATALDLQSKFPLSNKEKEFFDAVVNGKQPSTQTQRHIADRLCSWGWLKTHDRSYTPALPQSQVEIGGHYIWLPKTLVTGTTAGEPSPVARVRRYGDVMALRLLVDLYREQNLRDDAGISRQVLRQEFDRVGVGEQGIYNVWAFKPVQTYMFWGEVTNPHRLQVTEQPGKAFWTRLDILKQEGLLRFIPHLCETGDPESEVIHPCGDPFNPVGLDDLENRVSVAANNAGIEMSQQDECWTKYSEGYKIVVPVSRSYPNVQLVGIARLTYRPHTRRTSAWWQEMQKSLPHHVEQYKQLETNARGARVPGLRA